MNDNWKPSDSALDVLEMAEIKKESALKYLKEFDGKTRQEICHERKEKFLNIGKQKTFKIFSGETTWSKKDNFFASFKKIFLNYKNKILVLIILLFVLSVFFIW